MTTRDELLTDYARIIDELRAELYEQAKIFEDERSQHIEDANHIIDLMQECNRLESVLVSNGYSRCTSIACNCGSWHRTNINRDEFVISHAALDVAGAPSGTLQSRIDWLHCQRDNAIDALHRYGQHEPRCAIHQRTEEQIKAGELNACTCGLDEALK